MNLASVGETTLTWRTLLEERRADGRDGDGDKWRRLLLSEVDEAAVGDNDGCCEDGDVVGERAWGRKEVGLTPPEMYKEEKSEGEDWVR